MSVTKKITCLVLSLIMIITIIAPISAGAATTKNDLPMVYILGNGRTIYNKNGKKIFPTASLESKIKENRSAIVKAYTKSNEKNGYVYLKDEIKKIIDPMFKELRLDNNGNVSNGSYPKKNPTPKKKKSGYVLADYYFEYDSRIDPIANAAKLNTHINAVLKATGKKKVQLVSRCMGTTIAAAYLTKYGSSKVDTCIFYAGAMKGLLPISATFAGDFDIDYTALRNYTRTNTDSEFSGLIQALTTIMALLPIGNATLNAQFKKIAKAIMPELILSTYGTMPAYWALVGEEYFQQAKSFVFGKQTSKYAGLIKKIDNYQNTVQRQLYNTLKNCQKKGMKINIIAKYNVSLPPLFTKGNQQADGLVELNRMSLGARCSNMSQSLSIKYLDYVASNGKSKYISKDQVIDASTCLFPEYTWFIKDCEHGDWATSINKLMYSMMASKTQYTIKTASKYPQFLQYNKSKNTITPLTSSAAYLARTNPAVSSYQLGTTSYTYNGTDRRPYTIVKDNMGNSLKNGTDYSVYYDSDCKNIGTHKATIKMKGYFSGSKTLNYKVLPGKVTGLKATATNNSVTLSWTKLGGGVSYNVYSYNKSTKKYTLLKTVTSNSIKITGLKTATAYTYAVKAIKKVNGTTYNGTLSSLISTGTACSAPSFKVATGSKKATITWSKANTTGYVVYMATSKNGTYSKIANIKSASTTKYVKSGLKSGKTYYFKVRAYRSYSAGNIYSTNPSPKGIKIK